MTCYTSLEAEFYRAGLYDIFKIVRITVRTLLSENRTAVKNAVEKMAKNTCFAVIFGKIEGVMEMILT